MANWIYSTGTHAAQSVGSGELGVLGRDAVVSANGATAIDVYSAQGYTAHVMVAGQALSNGASAIGGTASSAKIVLAETGLAAGTFGLSFWTASSLRIANAGEIIGLLTGIAALPASGSALFRLNNSGRVVGGDSAIAVSTLNVTTASVIKNAGEIEGGQYGIVKNGALSVTAEGILHIINSGTISGDVLALDLKAGNDRVVNTGLIDGRVDMGMGNDSFNTRFGEVRGTVMGGQGLDNFRPGRFEDTFDGGSENDTLDLRAAGGVAVDLRNILENTGIAEGDVYLNVENIIGSGAADRLYGSAAANNLRGMGGADVIDGDAGNDVITGGAGRDTMTGGAGGDQFVILSRIELGDTINDFGDTSGNEDQLRLSAGGLGGGLSAGAVAAGTFISRTADHAAQDANDRFILNKSDKTLWFDPDGNGAAAALLVVDLQDSTTFGAGDMVLI